MRGRRPGTCAVTACGHATLTPPINAMSSRRSIRRSGGPAEIDSWLRLTDKGAKTWLIQYRAAGTIRRMKLGTVSVLEPDKARDKAKELLGRVAGGGDPFAEARAAEQVAHQAKLAFYGGEVDDPRQDYVIGCRILTQPFFLPEENWIPIPASWSMHIQQGRIYDTSAGDGLHLWEAVMERSTILTGAPLTDRRSGDPTLIRPRLGQGAFRVSVTDVYQ